MLSRLFFYKPHLRTVLQKLGGRNLISLFFTRTKTTKRLTHIFKKNTIFVKKSHFRPQTMSSFSNFHCLKTPAVLTIPLFNSVRFGGNGSASINNDYKLPKQYSSFRQIHTSAQVSTVKVFNYSNRSMSSQIGNGSGAGGNGNGGGSVVTYRNAVPIDMLDVGYVTQCSSAEELERIIDVLAERPPFSPDNSHFSDQMDDANANFVPRRRR